VRATLSWEHDSAMCNSLIQNVSTPRTEASPAASRHDRTDSLREPAGGTSSIIVQAATRDADRPLRVGVVGRRRHGQQPCPRLCGSARREAGGCGLRTSVLSIITGGGKWVEITIPRRPPLSQRSGLGGKEVLALRAIGGKHPTSSMLSHRGRASRRSALNAH
jgi:hypothetical protein